MLLADSCPNMQSLTPKESMFSCAQIRRQKLQAKVGPTFADSRKIQFCANKLANNMPQKVHIKKHPIILCIQALVKYFIPQILPKIISSTNNKRNTCILLFEIFEQIQPTPYPPPRKKNKKDTPRYLPAPYYHTSS